MNLLLYAQQCARDENIQQATNPLTGWLPIIVIFLIFYFLLILPEQKKIKQHKQMLAQLKKGDHILLSSGIYGTIVNIKGEVLEVKISENVKIYVLKSAVSQVVSEETMKSIM
ncbi:MAG: preprotein translocase subunit YajC [Endomicrobia bacterium]|nr:preprotein translocase subunit YajC [Endomicrobiia bacterium]